MNVITWRGTAILNVITANRSYDNVTLHTAQSDVCLLELGVEWVVLVVDAPVGQHRKQDIISSFQSLLSGTMSCRSMEKQEVLILPLHGTDSPVLVEAQYGLHLSLSQLKVKHLHRKGKHKPSATAHVQIIKQQFFCPSPGCSPGYAEV